MGLDSKEVESSLEFEFVLLLVVVVVVVVAEMGNCYFKKYELSNTLPIISILSNWHYQLALAIEVIGLKTPIFNN